ncbi:YbhB/YbcL family Raf kinase inhibitor-like protein [Methanofollis aquaemaris]|uniref:YbhB/YbcL family Raf kinase inhibitor-like protein n=1 Tax=Methanofollis aquaemaris TaxID=126734 RepID=A0A8A3S7P5_9EURY|nr:YbhB/YbcL family Raf kinase inhibitor-like protein [Methanofollis aquaemaris]QSZ68155.1 YbhB/YbcL family Raf kinase inhibitor-like protein [Methanofollis aquaemaris]
MIGKTVTKLSVEIAVLKLPPNYTCDGEDVSPAISLGGVDIERTKSLALVADDPDSPGGGGFTHWLIWNIEPVRIIPEAIAKDAEISFPFSARQGENSFGKIGYSGPCPPRGEQHRYQFRVFGLDTELDLPAGASKKALLDAMNEHVVQYGDTYVLYGR